MAERVGLSDWAELTKHLHRFASSDTTAEEDQVRIDFGSAHVEVGRDGRVDTRMLLHEFEREGDVAFVFDHEAGTLTIESEDAIYTFRRTGG